MTAKEKARDLVDKMDVKYYYKLGGKNRNSKGLPISMHFEQQKQCALIAVDEIIKALRKGLPEEIMLGKGYWQEVKREIKNL